MLLNLSLSLTSKIFSYQTVLFDLLEMFLSVMRSEELKISQKKDAV